MEESRFKTEELVKTNKMQFKRGKCKILHLRRGESEAVIKGWVISGLVVTPMKKIRGLKRSQLNMSQ